MKVMIFALAAAVTVVGCANRTPLAATGPGNAEPQKDATLVAGKRGAFVSLKPNGTLTLEIQTNVAAGYRWRLAAPLDQSKLQLVTGGTNDLPPVALPPPGPVAPTTEKWVFKAVSPGTTKVRMYYARPNEPLNRTVYYDFTVNAE